jgi:hypothetical protein
MLERGRPNEEQRAWLSVDRFGNWLELLESKYVYNVEHKSFTVTFQQRPKRSQRSSCDRPQEI